VSQSQSEDLAVSQIDGISAKVLKWNYGRGREISLEVEVPTTSDAAAPGKIDRSNKMQYVILNRGENNAIRTVPISRMDRMTIYPCRRTFVPRHCEGAAIGAIRCLKLGWQPSPDRLLPQHPVGQEWQRYLS
jgi:hypothetical protein